MNDVLSFDEIKARYAPNWVLLGDIESDQSMELLSGRVLFHGPDRDEVFRKAGEYPNGLYAIEYLGTFPDDLVLVL